MVERVLLVLPEGVRTAARYRRLSMPGLWKRVWFRDPFSGFCGGLGARTRGAWPTDDAFGPARAYL